MSFETTFYSGGVNVDSGYRVQKIENCRIITGQVPISDYSMLLDGYSDNAVMAVDIANRIGATLVIGEPQDIERLRQSDLPVSESRCNEAEAARSAGLPNSIVNWLLTGERGRSSDAMCKAFFGVPQRAANDFPRDPDDLRRCLLFLETAGNDDLCRLDKLLELSPEWSALATHWNELVLSLKIELESTTEKSAPKTYELMQKILGN